ncbi:MAG: hypothetical protein ABIH34_01285 [Nanoarchaeota archaeon]
MKYFAKTVIGIAALSFAASLAAGCGGKPNWNGIDIDTKDLASDSSCMVCHDMLPRIYDPEKPDVTGGKRWQYILMDPKTNYDQHAGWSHKPSGFDTVHLLKIDRNHDKKPDMDSRACWTCHDPAAFKGDSELEKKLTGESFVWYKMFSVIKAPDEQKPEKEKDDYYNRRY